MRTKTKTILSLLATLALAAFHLAVVAAPVVQNVTAKQRYPWNGLVDITCNVSGMNGTAKYEIVLSSVLPDSGRTNELSKVWIIREGKKSSDLAVQTNGKYHLLWDGLAELGSVRYTNLVISVNLCKWHGSKVQLWEDGPYWAECNVGASKPEEAGYYFWWGDTVGYKRENNKWVATDGSSSNFSFGSGNTPTYDKDVDTLKSEGWITEGEVLTPAHDAAHVHWGGAWRMPTYAEFVALINNCTATWTTRNGVYGRLVTGKGAYADRSIFLPGAGYGDGSSLFSPGSYGNYWSSTRYSGGSTDAWSLALYVSYFGRYDSYRFSGQSVRPVQGFTDLATRAVNAANSSPFLFDTATITAEPIVDSLTLTWDAAWIGGSADAVVAIFDNGTEVLRTTGAGEFVHRLNAGHHDIVYRTYVNGVAQSQEYATTALSVWSYGYGDGLDVASGGDVHWQSDEAESHDGGGSLRSGEIGNGQESWIEMEVASAGRLTFWWKASSEGDSTRGEVFDYACLSVDGEARGTLDDVFHLSGIAIGGETDWQKVELDISEAGPHKIRWTYAKDDIDEGSTGEDCVWVDEVVWTPFVTVTFDLDGGYGTVPEAVSKYFGETFDLPSESGFDREDHVFGGWSDGVEIYSSGASYAMPYSDVTLTAQWARKTFLTFNIGGGEGSAPQVVKELAGTVVTLPGQDGFNREDHVFGGWSDGTRTYSSGASYAMPSSDVTLTAQWIAKQSLTFNLDGGDGIAPATIKDAPGAVVNLPTNEGISKPKHWFAGWSDGSKTYSAGAEYTITSSDVEFLAVWQRNELSVAISSGDVAHGGEIDTQGATITISPSSSPNGGVPDVYYTLDGSTPTVDSLHYTDPFFVGALGEVTVKAVAMMDNYFDSDVAEFSFSRIPFSLAECIGLPDANVTSGGAAQWYRITGDDAHDGNIALRSGAITSNQATYVEMKVVGSGEISFWWKVSSEISRGRKLDYVSFQVDGVEVRWMGGTTNVWTHFESHEVTGQGEHSLKWIYQKNDTDSASLEHGEDCAWLAEVSWQPDPSTRQWTIVYENLKGASNPNPSKYYEGYEMVFKPLSDISGYAFAGWTPSSLPVGTTGDQVVAANWNWVPEDAVVDASITGGKALRVHANWVRTELDQRFGAGKQLSFIDKFGDNYAAAMTKPTGKRDGAGNALAVWHDYVAGTDPTDVDSVFTAKIELKDGKPVISWEPDLNEDSEQRIYTVHGKAELSDAWHSPTNALDHFFKVDVAMLQEGTVTFNVGGGASVDPVVVRVGQPIGDLPTPTREGYDFLGWFTEETGGSEITTKTIVTDDMTIFAHWKPNEKVHRWSFNGDLTDSFGGQTATKVGNVTTDGFKYTTPGGSSGSAYIDLGNWILPTNGFPVTVEMWVTQDESVSYGRIFCWGAMPTEGYFTGNSQYSSVWIQMRWNGLCTTWKDVYLKDGLNNNFSFSVGTEYYVAVVLTPLTDGGWSAAYYAKDPSTGNTLARASSTLSNWSFQDFRQTDMVLGQTLTSWDPCSKNSYNELRIWNKAMTEEELTASAKAGPDAEL